MICFVKEDFEGMHSDNPLYIQAEFSKKLNNFCLLDLMSKKVTDESGNSISIDAPVMLRTTCTNVDKALEILESLNVSTVESRMDIDKIENWFKYYKTKRDIIESSAKQIFYTEFPACERLFIKSKKKNFSLATTKEKIVNRDLGLVKFIEAYCKDEMLLISNFLEVSKDSLGTKETRHIVINKKIISSSRCFYSLKHNVPKSQIRAAKNIVNQISKIEDFPKSYVLDIGEFLENGEKYIDVVEINPLSTSMCYVNNSIFEAPNYTFEGKNDYGFGYEFFFDF